MKRTLISLITALSLAGCTFQPYAGPSRPIHYQEPAFFHYQKARVQPTRQSIESTATYDVYKITFPSAIYTTQENDTVIGYYYKQHTRAPAILALPVMGGTHFFSTTAAEYLADHGFHVLRFERKKKKARKEKPDFEFSQRVFQQTIIDTRRGLDWLLTQKDVDADKVGIFGISRGAILSAIVMASDPRIKAGVFLLGGGDLASILMTSTEPGIQKFRARMKEKKRLEGKALKEELLQYTPPIDPLSYTHLLDPSTILMINARYDTVIRPEFSDKLWRALGKPARILVPVGHYSALLTFTYALDQSIRHFRRQFQPEKLPSQ